MSSQFTRTVNGDHPRFQQPKTEIRQTIK